MSETNEIKYKLLDYQADATINTNGIYEKHRVVGAVMPTGAGKSFLAMAQMLFINNEECYIDKDYFVHAPIAPDGSINKSKILYLAPTNEIALQIKLDIVEFVLGKTPEEIATMSNSQIDAEVKKAFPGLDFQCYQSLNDNFDYENTNPDLVILDEAHRSGAEKFEANTAKLLGCEMVDGVPMWSENSPESKKNIKVFSISATPERDVDGKDMTKVWAKAIGGYTDEELSDEARADLGIKLSLPEAEKRGIIDLPEVVYFDAKLAQTKEYQSLVRYANDEKLDLRIRNKAKVKLQQIDEQVLGIPGYHEMSDSEREKAIEEQTVKTLAEAVKSGKLNLNGKYILFVQHNNSEKTKMTTPEFLESEGEKLQSLIKRALEIAEISDVKMRALSLSGGFSDKVNADNLKEFNDKSTDKDTAEKEILFIVASEKLNEGVHVKGVSGSNMQRPISERENTTLRAQSILFLQQQGRTINAIVPGQPRKEKKVIFDFVNNYYIQNRNGAVDSEQRIDLFELTPTQQILVDAYNEISKEVPKELNITEKVPKLLSILSVLQKYQPQFNSDVIPKALKLKGLLDKEPFASHYEEIRESLISMNLVDSKLNYNIGKELLEARKAFWSGVKVFKNYSLKTLKLYGIVDITTKEGYEEFKKIDKNGDLLDERGFIQNGATEEFIKFNVYTGTEYGKDGKDVDGYIEGLFDPETRKDAEGYYRNGFNDEGKHRDTGTIHDKRGFMVDGINILTGTPLDKNGYNIQGMRDLVLPESSKIKVEGGFGRDGKFYKKLPNGEYAKKGEEYAQIYDSDGKVIKIDCNFFMTTGYKKNLLTGSELTTDMYISMPSGKLSQYRTSDSDIQIMEKGFRKIGKNYKEDYSGETISLDGYYVDGYDANGFNRDGIHKITGTKYNELGYMRSAYSVKAKNEIMKRIASYKENGKLKSIFKFQENGKYKSPKTGRLSQFNPNEFDCRGINKYTNDFIDMYGFPMEEYYKKEFTIVNPYGFKVNDIPIETVGKNIRDFYKTYIDPETGMKKTVKDFKGRAQWAETNILGTDRSGNMLKTGEQHPSLEITYKYIKECIENNKKPEKFIEELAMQKKELVEDARTLLDLSINQAALLYRICPELARTDKAKETMKILSTTTPDKMANITKRCPRIKRYITMDIDGYVKEIENLDSRKTSEPDYSRKQSLENQKRAVQNKLKMLRQMKKNDEQNNQK